MKLRIGDHLWVKRTLYTHHGIYIGKKKVVHYSGLSDGLQSGPVAETTLIKFSGGEVVYKRSYKNPIYKPSEVVERVRSRLGEQLYNVHSNNCEHFCCWAITGKHSSEQVEIVETFVGAIYPNGEIASGAMTVVKAIEIGDKEMIASAGKNLATVTLEKKVIGAAAVVLGSVAAPIIAPLAGIGYLASKLYRKKR